MKLEMETEIGALQQMPVLKLVERYFELFGEPIRSRNRPHLIRKIAWKLQVLGEGDLSERARKRAEELAKGTELRVTPPKSQSVSSVNIPLPPLSSPADPRLPMPGTAIVRQYQGKPLRVLVLEDGFEFEGDRYRSLSAVAKKITGSHINGFRFFSLEVKHESK